MPGDARLTELLLHAPVGKRAQTVVFYENTFLSVSLLNITFKYAILPEFPSITVYF